MSGPVKVDVLVVGSGAAGLSAAVTAAMHGASVMVAEKASVLGGTSAWSGGWLWIPRNPLARAEGIDEAADAPLTYLQHEMGGEAADIRLQTFLRYGPEMVEFFHQRTAVQFLSGSAMPDFHPSPGAANGGRSVTAQPYDGRLLGDWLHRLRPPLETISLGGMGIAGGADMAHFFNATRSPRSALYAARRLLRHGWRRWCLTLRRVTAISPPHRRTIRARGSGLANPSAASSTLPCATRWPGRRCPASLWPAASS
ncbi:3-oxosteroid 1-dehydrogenase [Klebsiella pneumoniae]|nr:3-oxosteroid 1-dehydrogenase [Klebsiella pneumoniae]CAH3388268.1 3-oxosteroid 1-dehydrogenase [Klebsiella pneumoniae]